MVSLLLSHMAENEMVYRRPNHEAFYGPSHLMGVTNIKHTKPVGAHTYDIIYSYSLNDEMELRHVQFDLQVTL